jgi:hypothetical protein
MVANMFASLPSLFAVAPLYRTEPDTGGEGFNTEETEATKGHEVTRRQKKTHEGRRSARSRQRPYRDDGTAGDGRGRQDRGRRDASDTMSEVAQGTEVYGCEEKIREGYTRDVPRC